MHTASDFSGRRCSDGLQRRIPGGRARGCGGVAVWGCLGTWCVHECGTARVSKGREGRSSSGCPAWALPWPPRWTAGKERRRTMATRPEQGEGQEDVWEDAALTTVTNSCSTVTADARVEHGERRPEAGRTTSAWSMWATPDRLLGPRRRGRRGATFCGLRFAPRSL